MKILHSNQKLQAAMLALSLSSTLLMAGCAMQGGTGSVTNTGIVAGVPAASTVDGTALGGGIPVSGSTVQLWEAGHTGYGSTATLVATATALTSTSGGFSIPYTCPTDVTNPQLYITVSGGVPIPTGNTGEYGGSGTNVPSIAMAAAIGPCSNFTSSTHILVNEVTTVGLVWALQQFIGVTPGTQMVNSGSTSPSFTIGSSSTNQQGMANAFGWAQILTVSTSATAGAGGVSPGTAVYGTTVESAQVYTIADILATCVNSVGASSGACSTLFSQTKPVTNVTANSPTAATSSNAPVDTLQAAYSMAINPLYNVQTLYNIIPPQTSFTPYTIFESTNPLTNCTSSVSPLCTSPINDFTVKVSLSPGSTSTAAYGLYLDNVGGIAFDSFGNAWVVNTCHPSAGACYANGASSYQPTSPTIVELSPTGVPILPVGVSSASGANPAAKISQFNLGGSAHTLTPGQSTSYANGVAVDTNNNVWVAPYGDQNIFTIPGSVAVGGLTSSSTSQTTGSTSAAGGNGGANYGTGSSWTSNVANSTALGVAGTNPAYPEALTVDGNNNVWFSLWGATGGTTIGSSTRAVGGVPTTTSSTNNCQGVSGCTSTAVTVPGSAFLASTDPNTANSSVTVVGGTDTYQISVDNGQVAGHFPATYSGQSLIWAFDGAENNCLGGQILHLFNTAVSSGSSPTGNAIKQGMSTPFGLIVPQGALTSAPTSTASGNCAGSKQAYVIPATTYTNTSTSTTYNAQPTANGQGNVVDGYGNTWVLNVNCVLSDVATGTGIPYASLFTGTCPANGTLVTLSKLTPTYTTNVSGQLTGTIASSLYTTPSFLNIGTTLVYETSTLPSGCTGTLPTYCNVSSNAISSGTAYLALDGNNNLWTYGNNGFIEVNNAGVDLSSPYGFIGPSPIAKTAPIGNNAKKAIAIDQSGNVWNGFFVSSAAAIIVLVGEAAPTQVPSVAMKNNTVGLRP